MFDIGFWEMAFIGVIALIVVGPERLPKVARSVGMWVGKAKRMVRDVKADIKSEMSEEELKEFRDFKKDLSGAKDSITDMKKSVVASTGIDDIKGELKETADGLKSGLDGGSEVLAESKTPSGRSTKKATKKKTAKKKAAKKKTAKKKTAKKKATKKKSTAKKTASKKSAAKSPGTAQKSRSTTGPSSSKSKPKPKKTTAENGASNNADKEA